MTVIFTVKKLGFDWVSRWLENGGSLQIVRDAATPEALLEARAGRLTNSTARRMIGEVRGYDRLYAEIKRQIRIGMHDEDAA